MPPKKLWANGRPGQKLQALSGQSVSDMCLRAMQPQHRNSGQKPQHFTVKQRLWIKHAQRHGGENSER